MGKLLDSINAVRKELGLLEDGSEGIEKPYDIETSKTEIIIPNLTPDIARTLFHLIQDVAAKAGAENRSGAFIMNEPLFADDVATDKLSMVVSPRSIEAITQKMNFLRQAIEYSGKSFIKQWQAGLILLQEVNAIPGAEPYLVLEYNDEHASDVHVKLRARVESLPPDLGGVVDLGEREQVALASSAVRAHRLRKSIRPKDMEKPSPQEAARAFLELMDKKVGIITPLPNIPGNELPVYTVTADSTYREILTEYMRYHEVDDMLFYASKDMKTSAAERKAGSTYLAWFREYGKPIPTDPMRLINLSVVLAELEPQRILPHLAEYAEVIRQGNLTPKQKDNLHNAELILDAMKITSEELIGIMTSPSIRPIINRAADVRTIKDGYGVDEGERNEALALEIIRKQAELKLITPIYDALHQVNLSIDNTPDSPTLGQR